MMFARLCLDECRRRLSCARAGLMPWLMILAGSWPALAIAGAEQVTYAGPVDPPQTLHLAEIWRLGGEDSDLMFGLMVEAICDQVGNVYLMDQQLCQVTMVSPAGEVLRTLGRQGEGPGEVSTPQGIALMSDGTLGLAEQFPGKFVKVTLAGEPAGSVTVSGGPDPKTGFTMIAGCRRRGGNLVIAGMFQTPNENGMARTSYLASIGNGGEELVRYRVHTTRLDFQKAHFVEREMLACFHAAHAVGPDGRVYAAQDRDRYAIEVFLPDGTLERVIEREFINQRRDAQQRARVNALFEVQARNLPFDITWQIEDCEQAITALHVGVDDNLWVQHSGSRRDLPAGIFTRFDLIDGEGRYLHEIHIACEANPDHDGLIFLDDGRVLLVKGLVLARLTATGSQGAVFEEESDTGPMEIICCRLVR